MEIHPQILIFAGSLIAILAITGLAKLLRLGGETAFCDEAEARRAAAEVEDGYEAVAVALDASGAGALLKDSSGRIMVIKPHGNQFAGRILTPDAMASISDERITVSTGEARFGDVDLTLANSAPWAEAINRLNSTDDA
ncbi:hypothetical protein [Erythrobacter sp. F6033]|uniref:hypothetical protein n=1 Tax=Erythrobacter sp. F6033 TaxID=2926401 RepID=UPI001FF44774|nr:hypothetical protein [Erythrobacter sp. F6033]MCK0127063.1 hypothetical protein [Erythrobacter sp. F6033]